MDSDDHRSGHAEALTESELHVARAWLGSGLGLGLGLGLGWLGLALTLSLTLTLTLTLALTGAWG